MKRLQLVIPRAPPLVPLVAGERGPMPLPPRFVCFAHAIPFLFGKKGTSSPPAASPSLKIRMIDYTAEPRREETGPSFLLARRRRVRVDLMMTTKGQGREDRVDDESGV